MILINFYCNYLQDTSKVMGAIISIAIGSAVATGKLDVLKHQINDIINKHKHISDTAKRLSDRLKDLDYGKYC